LINEAGVRGSIEAGTRIRRPLPDSNARSAVYAGGKIRILDLGSGTGLFGAMVGKAFPAAMLHLTIISEAMLAQAQ